MKYSLIITCEHAGNEIPTEFDELFQVDQATLQSHEGWDPGAWPLAQQISTLAGAPLFGHHITRLLIEPNRSLHSPQLFSRFSEGLPDETKKSLINETYLSYRKRVLHAIHQATKPVVHLSVHTFTPIWHGQPRMVDIGLLFDPHRSFEVDICNQIRPTIQAALPQLVVNDNKPYLGADDGFTTYLRTEFPDEDYAGIEIEVKQNLSHLAAAIAGAVSKAVLGLH